MLLQGNDGSRERVILATLAGHGAENRYRSQQSLPLRTDFELIWSPDWQEARTVLSQLSATYLAGQPLTTVLRRLQHDAEMLVLVNWAAITELASTLLRKKPKLLTPLKSGGQWFRKNIGMCVAGEEAVARLRGFQITATCA